MKNEKWGAGPWDNEPDRKEWTAHGFDCLALRNHTGAWCGYVAVKPSHQAFEKSYWDVHDLLPELDVHGGLTYSEHCQGNICHKTDDHEPVWWLGFDCAHAFDLIPGLSHYQSDTYRDLDYVVREVEQLAEQLVRFSA